MIPPENRLRLLGAEPKDWSDPNSLEEYRAIDWDQRRWIGIQARKDQIDLFDANAPDAFRALYNNLEPNVYSMTLSDDGGLVSTSTEQENDVTREVHYPPVDKLDRVSADETVRRVQLVEVDRLSPTVDLVRRTESSGASKVVVFKYALTNECTRTMWNELNIMKALSGHPLIVGFDRIVLDDVEPLILGFTINYVPGGTLEDNPNRTFLFAWLEQLTEVVDDLNLKHGIIHQDTAPRNIAIDPVANTIKLFDFDVAGKLGFRETDCVGRNDIDGVIFTLYEALTLDDHFRQVPHLEQDVSAVEKMVDWPLRVAIENGRGGITTYRHFLDQWTAGRRTNRSIHNHSEASEPIDWPEHPLRTLLSTQPSNLPWLFSRARPRAIAEGRYVVNWERPSAETIQELSNNQDSTAAEPGHGSTHLVTSTISTSKPDKPDLNCPVAPIAAEADTNKAIAGAERTVDSSGRAMALASLPDPDPAPAVSTEHEPAKPIDHADPNIRQRAARRATEASSTINASVGVGAGGRDGGA